MSDSFATENERLLDVIVSFGAENNRLKAENEKLKDENEALIRHVTGLTARMRAMEYAYEEIFKKNIPERIIVIK